jgi:hypothetical protein
MAAGISLVLTLLLLVLFQIDEVTLQQHSPTQVTQQAEDVFGPR